MDWQSVAQAKKASLLSLIPVRWRLKPSDIPSVAALRDVSGYICRFLTPQELAITNSTAVKVLANARSGEWSAVEITRAFCHRAAIAHQLVEICFIAAERQAEELDEYLYQTGRTLGPLHGLPVSLKDRFNINGLESACGYISWLGQKKDLGAEGTLVRKLRQLGAVFFVKTNVPMSMLMGETSNNIIGSTINPYNRNLSAGGASGGEGALLAMKGSPLGWGSDIAGSIRIPCAFNNLYGLRPSFGRLPASGMATSLPGLPTAGSVVGPMTADLPSLEMATKTILDTSPWKEDIDVLEMPWSDDKIQTVRNRACRRGERDGKLTFGIMNCDKFVLPHPPVNRAMKLVTQALLERGYEVIEWDPPLHSPAIDVLFQIFGSTAGASVRQAIDASGEPPLPQLLTWYRDIESQPASSLDFWDLCRRRDEYRAAYNEYWASTQARSAFKRPIDGVILPVAPSAATEEGLFSYYAYSGIVNMLDYTSGSFPVTFADRSLDFETPDYEPMNLTDRSVWRTYQKDLFDGAPVGLQVMGKRLQEERVIGLMEAIAAALQDYTGSESSQA
ncbi:hypothetical protein MMC27_006107 [Xylographa pallens]|nr:hypothetical protein [Xylographa pallens]